MKMLTVVESEAFSLCCGLIGDSQFTDEVLENLISDIAAEPDAFPIVSYPTIRMGCVETKRYLVAVFFRANIPLGQVELLWATVKNKHLQQVA